MILLGLTPNFQQKGNMNMNLNSMKVKPKSNLQPGGRVSVVAKGAGNLVEGAQHSSNSGLGNFYTFYKMNAMNEDYNYRINLQNVNKNPLFKNSICNNLNSSGFISPDLNNNVIMEEQNEIDESSGNYNIGSQMLPDSRETINPSQKLLIRLFCKMK
jgi:hypothetical protein